jgi:arylsulfatase A-like enzyme/Flp pilus assembly protein TadD
LARPFRYTFIFGLVAASTALAAVGGWRYARASAPVPGPIVLITVDSLRADHLPLYGYKRVKTPAFDALGADGVVFERAYSHSPQSLPAHASLLSGRLPFETGVRDAIGFSVRDGERMLAEILDDRGFATGAVVSSIALGRDTGLAQGFAFFDDELSSAGGRGERTPGIDDGVGRVRRSGEASERIAETWLQSIGSPRAFLFLHLAEPHAPYEPPDRFDQYEPYDGAVAHADEIVGRLVKYLKGHQLYDQSTIILVGDHGEGLGSHGELTHGLLVYDETVRIPLVVKQAAGEGAGRRVTDVAQHIDLMPTILDLAKAPVPGDLPGQSLKPLLSGSGRMPRRYAYSESLLGRFRLGSTPLLTITDGRYRFIQAPREELFDVVKDPAERINLADDEPEVAAELRDALERLNADAETEAPPRVDDGVRRRVEALGHLGAALVSPDGADDEQADPKDKVAVVNQYRAAVAHDVRREWPQAIAIFESLLKDAPRSPDLWARLAEVGERADRLELAVDARTRAVDLAPDDPDARLAAAFALLRARRLDDAERQAEQAIALARSGTGLLVGSAREILVRVAIARRNPAAARAQAALALEAEPGRPLPTFVNARLLQEQRRHEAALPLFEQAIAELGTAHGRPIADLHFHAGETFARLGRLSEAEYHYLEELRAFPGQARARAELAGIYHATGRTDEAAQALADLLRLTPTPDAFGLAARAWTSFGNQRQAAAVRAEARRAFGPSRAPAASPAQQ